MNADVDEESLKILIGRPEFGAFFIFSKGRFGVKRLKVLGQNCNIVF
jgi:hypothetical protein